jgi:small subunit ribosomal protein S16
MAVKLRLMRMGKKKQPTYRVVAADARSPRNGRFIEIIGTYEPRQDPSVIKIDNERAVHWLRHGAQPTERVAKLLKISGAWTDATGETVDAAVPAAARKKSRKQIEKEAEAAEKAAAPPADDDAGDDESKSEGDA